MTSVAFSFFIRYIVYMYLQYNDTFKYIVHVLYVSSSMKLNAFGFFAHQPFFLSYYLCLISFPPLFFSFPSLSPSLPFYLPPPLFPFSFPLLLLSPFYSLPLLLSPHLLSLSLSLSVWFSSARLGLFAGFILWFLFFFPYFFIQPRYATLTL